MYFIDRWGGKVSVVSLLLLTACGGSSGSIVIPQAGTQGSGVQNNGAITSTSPIDSATCSVELDDVLVDNIVPGGVLANRSSGCDYLVNRRLTISNDVSIEPGVTFLIGPGSALNFRGSGSNNRSDVQMLGTAAAPISFVGSADTGAWDSIEFFVDNLAMTNVQILGGGLNAGENDGAVKIDANSIDVRNVTFSGSASNGLFLTGTDTEFVAFNNNLFSNNQGYGLLLTNLGFAQFGSDNNFGVGEAANLEHGIGVLRSFNAMDAGIIQNAGVPYVLLECTSSSSKTVEMSDVHISAGVEFNLPSDLGLSLSGVTATGTAESPVVFSGIDGAEWGGLTVAGRFAGSQNSALSHVRIENAGSGEGSPGGALSATNADSTILENISFVDSANWAIFCGSSSNEDTPTTILEGITFTGSGAGDFHPDCNIAVEDSAAITAPAYDISSCAEHLVAFSVRTPYEFTNTDAECDYFVSGTLEIGSTAQIDPGTTFVFARGASMSIDNTVLANGSALAPITLRGEIETEGFWRGLTLSGSAHSLQHIDIMDGGFAFGAGLNIPRVSGQAVSLGLTMDSVSVAGSHGDGLFVGAGVTFEQFTNNTFVGNAGYGAQLSVTSAVSADQTTLYDSAMAANGRPGVRLHAASNFNAIVDLEGADTVLPNIGVPWQTATIRADGGETLTIAAGNTIHFDPNAALIIASQSTVSLSGTADSPVVLSGLPGDTSNWIGVSVSSQSTLSASFAELIGGANDETFRASGTLSISNILLMGTVSVNRSLLDLSNVTIRDSLQWGISCSQTEVDDLMLSQVSYADNTSGNIQLECGS